MTLILLALACATDIEGDEPGECSDGADNDADGYFDCQDKDCWASPDCSEGDTDTDSDSDSDTDSDTDSDSDSDADPVGESWSTMALTYTLNWEFTIATIGLSDCTQIYDGMGTRSTTDSSGPTFMGTWEMRSSDCKSALDNTVWVPESGSASHSVQLAGEQGPWTGWSAHSGDASNPEWYIQGFDEELDAGVGLHIEDEPVAEVPGLILHHRVTIELAQ